MRNISDNEADALLSKACKIQPNNYSAEKPRKIKASGFKMNIAAGIAAVAVLAVGAVTVGAVLSNTNTSLVDTAAVSLTDTEQADAEPTVTTAVKYSDEYSLPIADEYFSEKFSVMSKYSLSAPQGTDIYAVAAGEVLYADFGGGYGRAILISHGNFCSLYAHCDSLLVKTGDKVAVGEHIAEVGISGMATEYALGYEGLSNADAEKYIEQWKEVNDTTAPDEGEIFEETTELVSYRAPLDDEYFANGFDPYKEYSIPTPLGNNIYASESGRVLYAGDYENYGKVVLISYNGLYSFYYHCEELYVETDDTVFSEQVIASVGATGWTTDALFGYLSPTDEFIEKIIGSERLKEEVEAIDSKLPRESNFEYLTDINMPHSQNYDYTKNRSDIMLTIDGEAVDMTTKKARPGDTIWKKPVGGYDLTIVMSQESFENGAGEADERITGSYIWRVKMNSDIISELCLSSAMTGLNGISFDLGADGMLDESAGSPAINTDLTFTRGGVEYPLIIISWHCWNNYLADFMTLIDGRLYLLDSDKEIGGNIEQVGVNQYSYDLTNDDGTTTRELMTLGKNGRVQSVETVKE